MTEREEAPLRADPEPGTPAEDGLAMAAPDDEIVVSVPGRGSCRTDLRGWAGAHLHGAVRPRRRAAGRGRPPGRWC